MFATVAVFKWILRRLKLVNITDSGRETSLPIWHLGCDTVLIFTVLDGYFTLCQRAWLLVAGWLDTEPGQRPTASVAAWIVVSLLRPQTCALDSASWRRSWCRCQRCDCSSETTGPTDTRTQPAAAVQACQFYATFSKICGLYKHQTCGGNMQKSLSSMEWT